MPDYIPEHFMVMTYNIAHGRGTSFHQTLVRRHTMERTLRDIARRIQVHHPHVIALQEIDQGSFWNHNVDQLAYLQELLGYSHSGHGIHKEDALFFGRLVLKYGVGILSRLEPLEFTSQAFSLGFLDTKGFAAKRLSFHGVRVMVLGLHLDFQRHQRRLLQIQQVVDFVQARRDQFEHLIIMGDFNCTVQQERSALTRLMQALSLKTWAPDNKADHISFPGLLRARLDYILIDEQLEFAHYETGRARLSDHEYVVAHVRVPAR